MNELNFQFQINGEDVRQASHERVVNLIRKSGDLVSLTVVTISLSPNTEQNPGKIHFTDTCVL